MALRRSAGEGWEAERGANGLEVRDLKAVKKWATSLLAVRNKWNTPGPSDVPGGAGRDAGLSIDVDRAAGGLHTDVPWQACSRCCRCWA
jgi:hypothetical protein